MEKISDQFNIILYQIKNENSSMSDEISPFLFEYVNSRVPSLYYYKFQLFIDKITNKRRFGKDRTLIFTNLRVIKNRKI